MYANQVDVMQACVIAIEAYQAFRYVIVGIDLMPQIMITKEDSFFHASVDELYAQVLRPFFEATLDKHSLSSSVVLNLLAEPLGESKIFFDSIVKIIVKAKPDGKYVFAPSKEKSRFGNDLFEKFRNKVVFDTYTTFKIGNYYRT